MSRPTFFGKGAVSHPFAHNPEPVRPGLDDSWTIATAMAEPPTTAIPRLSIADERAGEAAPLRALADGLLVGLLAAQKAGALPEMLRRRPAVTRWFARRLLPPLRRVAGDAIGDDPTQPLAWQLLLRGTLAGLRPDGVLGLADIDRQAWLEPTNWRPLLALLSHHGFVPVPSFPERYRARPEEAPAEQLCGLWGVGPSTVYRYLDRGRRALADALLSVSSSSEERLRHQRLLQHEVYVSRGLDEGPARRDWHARQAAVALSERKATTAIWHLLLAQDVAGFVVCLTRFPVELAADPDTDALLRQFAGLPIEHRQRCRLLLAQASLARARGDDQVELRAIEAAIAQAAGVDESLMLGVAYGALGKYYEPRDEDRAFACYQESFDALLRAGVSDVPAAVDDEVLEEYARTLIKLAWLYALRKDPRCKDVLDRVEGLRTHLPQALDALAMLEQTWGEYWRRNGDLLRALEHKHRALHIYERLGDREAVLKTFGNLSLIYCDAKDYARATEYSHRVLEMAQRFPVEPQIIAATHAHLGTSCFWQGKYDRAIEHYQRGLEVSQRAELGLFVWRAHYNLAEAHYKRFLASEDPADEAAGDAHTAAALVVRPANVDSGAAEATRHLKREILGVRDEPFFDRMLPGELAAHYREMSEVQRHRGALALAQTPQDRAASHLALARLYLEISVKEREAAVALIDSHDLGGRFAAEFEQLRETFASQLSREEALGAQWRSATADLFDAARCEKLLQHLLRAGSVSKSGYAELSGIGLATASKQLVALAERGLLTQTGRGPATRYLLADAVRGEAPG